MTRDYTDLRIWKEAHNLTLDLHEATKKFPFEEKFGLVKQIDKASASIGANIVEGCGQNSTAATRRYLFISYSSLKEIAYHVLLAYDLGYIEKEKYENFSKRIITLSKMIHNFISNMPNEKQYIKPNSN